VTNGTQPAGGTPAKKGLSPLAWIAIGCGVLVVVGAIAITAAVGFGMFKAKQFIDEAEGNPAKAIATMAVRANPELDLVETDDEAGTITVRNNKTGEEVTVDFEELAEGRLRFETAEGETTIDISEDAGGDGGSMTVTGPEGEEVRVGGSASLDKVPDWVPLYPAATGTQGTFTQSTQDQEMGWFTQGSDDPHAEVVDYYRRTLEDRGYEIVTESTTSTGQGTLATLRGELDGGRRSVTVNVTETEGKVQIVTNYEGKK
jgi:hypothetical protein